MTVHVHDNDGFRARRDYLFDLLGGYQTRSYVNVRENGPGALDEYALYRTVIRNGAHYHVVAGPDADSGENSV